MRRSRLTAALVAVLMATSVLLVPGTAQADVANMDVSVDFDNLAPDRIATVTVKAESAAGVTDVQAEVQHKLSADDETPIGTLPFTLIDGTENDGTWQGKYKVDIEAYPGYIGFDVAVTTADGATQTHLVGIGSCYEGRFADLTATPATIDPDEIGLKVTGRLLLQKTRESEPEPAPQGITVQGAEKTSTQTAADGSFALTVPSLSTRAIVPGGQVVCLSRDDARFPSDLWRDSDISASIVTPQPVEAGAEVTVKGVVRWDGPTGDDPLENITVGGYTDYGTDSQVRVATVDSAEDGSFQFTFTAQGSGPVTVQTEDRNYLSRSRATAGVVSVSGAPEFAAFSAASQPGPAGSQEDTVTATGRLVDAEGPIAGERVLLEWSLEEQTYWNEAATAVTAADGSFSLRTTASSDLHYRARFAGSDDHVASVGQVEYVDVRETTSIVDFGAQAGVLGPVWVQGKLKNYSAGGTPVAARPVHFYFRPDGGSAWEYRGSTTTDGNGAFAGEFSEHRDGDWTVWFWGDDEYFADNTRVVNVDIRDDFSSEFAKFDVLPKSVAPDEPVTVSGVLRWPYESGPQAGVVDKPVYVYFMPAGSSTWKQVAVTRTRVDGSFERTFTAKQDGYWTVWFWGDDDYAKSNSPTRYVDVQ